MTGNRETRLAHWERRTDLPLTILALAFLVAYAWPILDLGLSNAAVTACTVVTFGSWAAFAVDYAVRCLLSESRRRYVRGHLFDLAVIVLPLLRPLRALRLVTALSVLNRTTETGFRGRVVTFTVGAAALLAFTAALAVLDAERRGDHANITGFGDAMWWAMTTMTTVGYGDRYPTTGQGRMVGVGLMLGGIALLGVVTATFASWFVERVRNVEAAEAETRAELDQVLAELRGLRKDIRTGAGRPPSAE